ncbi:MAG TPA: 30S ribosomal protein S8 [Candidatus Paceibacterota bacterium]|nr:30S ribosomal protein S8 [Candidatus Paceibacterota bacterium]
MYTRLLTQIKNSQSVSKERIKFPYSIMDEKILEILQTSRFISSFEKKGRNPKKYLEIILAYKNGKGSITGVKFVSTPSRHIYRKYTQLKKVKQGYGVSIISTSRGIMTDAQARKEKVGGELLFYIW